jgi:hypothetical protein
MAYVAQWERLSDAATRVATAAGVSKDKAQSDICQAIADGAVTIRCKLKRHTTRPMTSTAVLQGKDFDIPTNIRLQDLDWERSRPVRPWTVPHGNYSLPGRWELEWIELLRSDVTNVLCPAATRGETLQRAPSPTEQKTKSRPAREGAERAIRELYPEGLPDQTVLPNANLYRRVGEKLKALGLPVVSDDTILRAAQRRRK